MRPLLLTLLLLLPACTFESGGLPFAPPVSGLAAWPAGVADLGGADARAVTVRGSLAFVACGDDGVQIVDISDISNPVTISTIEEHVADDLVVHDDQLYVLTNPSAWSFGGGQLTVIDVIDPLQPGEGRSVVREFGKGSRLTVSGSAIAVAAGEQGLFLAAGSPGTMAAQDTLLAGDVAVTALLDGSHLFVLERTREFDFWLGYGDDLDALTIIDAAEARLMSRIDLQVTDGAADLALVRDWLFVAREDGVTIIDVKDPNRPDNLGRLPLSGATAVACDGQLGAVATGDLILLDLSQAGVPTNPIDVPTPGDARDVAIQAGLVIVADGPGGLRLYEVGPPPSIEPEPESGE